MANHALLRLETIEVDGLRFRADMGRGHDVVFDSGKAMAGVSPVTTLIAALSACEGMDVISILRKKRQTVTAYEIAVSGERRTEHPRAYTRIEVIHRIRGRNVEPLAVEEAIRLSVTKYCSVRASIDPGIDLVNRYEIFENDTSAASATGVVDTAVATDYGP